MQAIGWAGQTNQAEKPLAHRDRLSGFGFVGRVAVLSVAAGLLASAVPASSRPHPAHGPYLVAGEPTEAHQPSGEPKASPISSEEWAQSILDSCSEKENNWEADLQALTAELQQTAQSGEQRDFPAVEQRAHAKRMEGQRQRHLERLSFVFQGQKARSLAGAADRFRVAAGLSSPRGKNPLWKSLTLLLGHVTPCNLQGLESTLFLAVFGLPFTHEQLTLGLTPDRIGEEFERVYRDRLKELGSLEQAYRTLRPQDEESSLVYVDELMARLAGSSAIGRQDPRTEAARRELLEQLQGYFRLTAEQVRIRAYLHAKVEEIEGAVRTNIPDRTLEKLFERVEDTLYPSETALRKVRRSDPDGVVARLAPILDAWFREDALPSVQRVLLQDPFSAHWFFVQTGGIARRPRAFAGSRVQVGSEVFELQSLKNLGLPESLRRLRHERIPAGFVRAYLALEQAFTDFSLSREEGLQQLESMDLSPSEREKLRRRLEALGETEKFSTLDIYTQVVRDANRIGAGVDWEFVRLALRLLHQGKQQRLEQETQRALNAVGEQDRARLAAYLQTAGALLLELESRQATELRFQEVSGGGLTRWLLRDLLHLLRRPGLPRQLWAPGGVTGGEFAELIDGIAPKNAESGVAYHRKPTSEIRLVHDGRDYHRSLVEVIDTAGSFLNLSTFDWKVDQGGKEVAYRLMAKKLGLSYDRLVTTFPEGLPLEPESESRTLLYDIPSNRMKNLLVYLFLKLSDTPRITEVRRELEAALGDELTCPSVETCGDLSRLQARTGEKYDAQRANEPGYQQAWEAYGKLQVLFEDNPVGLRQTRPQRSLADYIAGGDQLRQFVRRYGLKRAENPVLPFDVNVLVDAKQNADRLRLGRPSRQFPYLVSDPMWDLYGPLYEFDVRVLVWKGGVEFPWHLGPLPLPGRKLVARLPMPFIPYPWLQFLPGLGWVKGLGLQYLAASDLRVWWAMAMHVKNISSEERALQSGMGFASKYFNPYRNFAIWHDTGVEVQGPIVGDVNDNFVKLFNAARVNNAGLPAAYGLKIPRLSYTDYRYPRTSTEGSPAWVATTDPELGYYNYRGVFLAALAAARKNISIENAFFTDPLLGRLIVRKAHEFRGRVDCEGLSEYECAQKMRDAVPIYLVLADTTDQPMLDVVGHAYVHEMRHLGVKIYRWNPGRGWSATRMMHTKAWLVDNEAGQAGLAYVGSANATQRSHISDNEMGIVSVSPEFSRQVHEQLFCGDMRADARLEGTEKFHVTWATKRLARLGRGLRQLLVNVLWLF